MNYPTPEEVEGASQHQLGKWLRFLPSPGMSAIDKRLTELEQTKVALYETQALGRIGERFEGWNPELSKAVGWDPPKE